jgi:hypothetical protein
MTRLPVLLLTGLLASIQTAGAAPAEHTTELEGRHSSFFALVRDDGSVKSVSLQPALLPLDIDSGNAIKGETGDFKPATYWFRKETLRAQQLNPITRIYAVARVRTVPIVSSGGDWVVAEYFAAGSHVPACRYTLLGESVLSQYVLDRHGKVVRIADVGWRTDTDVPERAALRVTPIGQHPTWIRVFDVNADGALRLMGTAWTLHAPHAGSDAPPPRPEDLRFGNAEGRERWTTMRQFETALGLDLSAKRIAGEWHPARP